MKPLTALAISLGILAGIAVWGFLSIGSLLIWAALIALGCYFQAGGDQAALRNTVVCNIFGAILGWLAALLILVSPFTPKMGLPLSAAILVGITIMILVAAANVKALSAIPASVYGYAAVFAFLLQTTGKLTVANLLSLSLNNALIVVAVSMVIGSVLGFVASLVSAQLTHKATAAA